MLQIIVLIICSLLFLCSARVLTLIMGRHSKVFPMVQPTIRSRNVGHASSVCWLMLSDTCLSFQIINPTAAGILHIGSVGTVNLPKSSDFPKLHELREFSKILKKCLTGNALCGKLYEMYKKETIRFYSDSRQGNASIISSKALVIHVHHQFRDKSREVVKQKSV